MKKDKSTKKAEETPEQPEAVGGYIHVIHRFDKVMQFPAGWDRGKLSDDNILEIRDYLRENKGAGQMEIEVHNTQHRITGNPRTRQTALFFVQTVPGGELVAGGNPIPALKGQLVILPAGEDFKIKATTHPREIIEFTF